MLDHEALALLAHGYTRYWVVSLYCPMHGMWRVAIAYAPENGHHPCPACQQSCASGVLPCIGYTRKALPMADRLFVPPPWEAIASEEHEALEQEPVRVVDDDRYISPSGRIARLGPRHAAAGGRLQIALISRYDST